MQDGFDSSAWVIEDIVFLPSVILLQNQFGYIVQCTTLRTVFLPPGHFYVENKEKKVIGVPLTYQGPKPY